MKLRPRWLYLSVCTVTVMLSATLVGWHIRPAPLDFSCHGNLVYHDTVESAPVRFDGEIVANFLPDGEGSLNVSGSFTYHNQQVPVSRQALISWKTLHNNLYDVRVTSVIPYSQQSLPAGLFDHTIIGLKLGEHQQLRFNRLPGGAVNLSDFYSPVLVCTE